MTELIINKQSTINAEGTHNKGNKGVFCITTRTAYVSGLDASLDTGVARSEISRCCRGKKHTARKLRFCFTKDIPYHLEEIFESDKELLAKAAAYDEITARERAAREAEEKYVADLVKAEQDLEHINTLYDKTAAKLVEYQTLREEAYNTLRLLKETGVQYAI
jgi:hypothetical protein